MSDHGRCPLCGWDADIRPGESTEAPEFVCKLCGTFRITRSLLSSNISEADKKLFVYLPAHTRQETERASLVTLTTANWRDLARPHSTTPVSRKLDKVLDHVAIHSEYPGDHAVIDFKSDYPLFDATSDEEVGFLVDHLITRKLLLRGRADGTFILSAEGWERIEPTVGGGILGRCFVAMSFDPSLDDAYEQGVRAAIEDDCKLTAIRVDRIHHNEKICDLILAEIKKAQFVVADFTHHKAGAYFEAGYAMGLSRPVIWTVRKDQLKNSHFDTRQYNHIEWDTPAELRTRLADRVRATILR